MRALALPMPARAEAALSTIARSPLARGLTALATTLALAACGASETPDDTQCEGGCFTPPAAVCQGGMLLQFSPLGECRDTGCFYQPSQIDCTSGGGTCEDGACVEPVDLCEDVVCDAVPDTTCDGNELLTYAPGTCDAETGDCSYAETREDCTADGRICSNGMCRVPADPCIGVECNDEPDDFCDGDTAVRYNDTGTCSEGECIYGERARVDCVAGGGTCDAGRCTAVDLCEGVTCTTPPAAVCDGDIAVRSEVPGTCVDGECRYLESEVDCTDTGEVCVEGACEPPGPCATVVCNLPPAARCEGAVALRFPAEGLCTDGACDYPATRTDCALTGQRCERGACVGGGPCDGVVCNDPPEPGCSGTVAMTYAAVGVCELGDCDYAATIIDCADSGRICDGGECVSRDPLCDRVTCVLPPPDECDEDGLVLTAYAAVGTCSEGTCDYAPATTDCSATGRVCSDGECVAPDLCVGVVCSAEPRCEGGVAVTYSGDGTCVRGTCDFARVEVRTDCGTLGTGCFEGACRRQVDTLEYGDIVITEIMPAPSSGDPLDAWFEVENRTGRDVDLEGLVINGNEEGGEISVVDRSFVVAAGGFAIFAASSPGPNPTVPTWVLDDENFVMTEDRDQIYLENEGGMIAFTEFSVDAYDYSRGVSAERDASLTELGFEGDPAVWCAARRLDAGGEISTAGRRGDACTARIASGGLAVSEVLLDGRGARPEDAYQWIEFLNLTGDPVSLGGVVIENDAGDWYSFPADVVVGDGELAVLGSASTSTTVADARFTDVVLDADGGLLRLVQDDVTIDVVVLSTALVPGPNASTGIEGAINATRNDEAGNWCAQDGLDGGAGVGVGTPGRVNVCAE